MGSFHNRVYIVADGKGITGGPVGLRGRYVTHFAYTLWSLSMLTRPLLAGIGKTFIRCDIFISYCPNRHPANVSKQFRRHRSPRESPTSRGLWCCPYLLLVFGTEAAVNHTSSIITPEATPRPNSDF